MERRKRQRTTPKRADSEGLESPRSRCRVPRHQRRAAPPVDALGGRMSARVRSPKTTVPGQKHPAKGQPVGGETGAGVSRLCLISLKVDAALRNEIDAYAEAHGITRSRAANHYLAIARETIREREGVPGGRADELMDADLV